MKTKLLLVGAGGFGRVALEHAVEQYDCAFVDDGPELGTLVNGVAVIGRISDLQRLHDEAGYEQLIVTIGNRFITKRRRLATAFPISSAPAPM